MDRVICKILSSPIFDDELSNALTDLSLHQVEKFVVLGVTGSLFWEKIAFLLQKSKADSVQVLIGRHHACSALIEIINKSTDLFL